MLRVALSQPDIAIAELLSWHVDSRIAVRFCVFHVGENWKPSTSFKLLNRRAEQMITHRGRRRIVLSILLIILAVLCRRMITAFHQEDFQLPSDMLAYWSSTNLLTHRRDPYDWQALLDIQRTLRWSGKEPVVAWNRPILQVLLLPLGALPFPTAVGVWVILNLTLIGIGAVCTWSVLSPGPDGLAPIYIPILTFSFAPSGQTVLGGQVTALVLLGLAGFLVSRSRKCEFLAGTCCVLLLEKPHLVYLLLPLLLINAALERRWAMLAGFGTTLLILLGIATYLYSSWPASYVRLFQLQFSPSLYGYVTPTVRSLLYVYFDTAIGRYLWLLFLPLVICLFLRYGHWLDSPSLVNWALVGSLLTTPFAWASDHVVLLLPILQVVAKPRSYPISRRLLIFGTMGLMFSYSWWLWVDKYQQFPSLAVPLVTAALYGYSRLGRPDDEGDIL